MLGFYLRPCIVRCLRRAKSSVAHINLTAKSSTSRRLLPIIPDNKTLDMGIINPQTLKEYVDPVIAADDYFQLDDIVKIEEMFEARVHYGHKVGTLKENMKWALYGQRLDVCIFDLEVTRRYLVKALKFLASMAYQDAVILFVSANRAHIEPVELFARRHGQYAHTRRWRTDTFSNSRVLFRAPIRLPDIVMFTGTLSSVLERHPAVIECAKLAIPTVAIVDSNVEPNYITYPIPGNDDSLESLLYYLKLFDCALAAGKRVREAQDAAATGARSSRRLMQNPLNGDCQRRQSATIEI